MSLHSCCFQGFQWSGTPTGRVEELANLPTYVAGNNKTRAILLICDIFGWKFVNNRLIADHFAQETDSTVYVPDFFHGAELSSDDLINERWDRLDLQGFLKKNSREIREPEIFACAKALRTELGYSKLGAVGYCYGGWAVFRLGAKEFNDGTPLVDAVSTAHPSLLTKEDIDAIGVPVQILAPEHDMAYSQEMKTYTLESMMTKSGSHLAFDYQHFPGVTHGFAVRGDERKAGERASMTRAKNAVVAWFTQYLTDKKE